MTRTQEFDAVVVGAGFSGMYMLHLLRSEGYSVRLYEAGSNVGGTWYWNRYPGARCDITTKCYCYSFSEELYRDWTWSSEYPEQPEILDYLNFVANKLDLRRDIQCNTRTTSAAYDETLKKWRIQTENGDEVLARFFIPALGNLSIPHAPDIKNLESFQGEIYHTSRWPHEEVDFSGKRVAVVGTGSSGVQSITAIAKQAAHLTVFQRTAQYVLPVANRPLAPEEVQEMKKEFPNLRRKIRENFAGVPDMSLRNDFSALDVTPEERHKIYEQLWEDKAGTGLLVAFNDITTNEEANLTAAEFIRSKIKEIVKDPNKAEKLLPNYLFGGKRQIIATDYYETYNQDNVDIVDLKKTPFVECAPNSLRTTESEHELDIIVFASGFDAMTGSLMRANIRGRNGILLKDKWEEGSNLKTFLSIHNVGFPNMFTITGPHFPLTTNAVAVNEVLAEWIFDCIKYIDKNNMEEMEVTAEAEEGWTNTMNEVGAASIYAKVDSWYTGANIGDKPRAFLGWTGDFVTYQNLFKDAKDYRGFIFTPKQTSVGK